MCNAASPFTPATRPMKCDAAECAWAINIIRANCACDFNRLYAHFFLLVFPSLSLTLTLFGPPCDVQLRQHAQSVAISISSRISSSSKFYSLGIYCFNLYARTFLLFSSLFLRRPHSICIIFFPVHRILNGNNGTFQFSRRMFIV